MVFFLIDVGPAEQLFDLLLSRFQSVDLPFQPLDTGLYGVAGFGDPLPGLGLQAFLFLGLFP